MREDHLTTEVIQASEARANWSQLLNRVIRERARVIVEKSGLPVAVLISTQDLERLNRLEARFSVLDRIGGAFADVAEDELEAEVANALAAARVEVQQADRRTAGSCFLLFWFFLCWLQD